MEKLKIIRIFEGIFTVVLIIGVVLRFYHLESSYIFTMIGFIGGGLFSLWDYTLLRKRVKELEKNK